MSHKLPNSGSVVLILNLAKSAYNNCWPTEIFRLLGYHAVQVGFKRTIWNNLSVSHSRLGPCTWDSYVVSKRQFQTLALISGLDR
jgi:hypothetical protein